MGEGEQNQIMPLGGIMTEYVGRYSHDVGIWPEVIPDHTVQDILILIAIVIAVTIVVAHQYHHIHTAIVKRVHRESTVEGSIKLKFQ